MISIVIFHERPSAKLTSNSNAYSYSLSFIKKVLFPSNIQGVYKKTIKILVNHDTKLMMTLVVFNEKLQTSPFW